MWDPFAQFEAHTLPNGLSLHVAHWPGRAFEAVGFLIHSGAECDPPGYPGAAHFIEHVANANALASHDEIEAFFDECGGSADFGTTGWSGTTYGFSLPADVRALARGFDIFSSLLVTAKAERDIEAQRSIVREEYRSVFLVPALSADAIARRRRRMYRGSSLEDFTSPLGTPESIEAMTPEVLQGFLDRWYVPANTSIVAVGGMPSATMLDLIKASAFSSEKPGARRPLPEPFTPPILGKVRTRLPMREHMPGLTSGAYGAFTALESPGRRQSVGIAASMLDNLMNEEVRERRGWTYDISCASHRFRSCSEIAVEYKNLAREGLRYIERILDECLARAWDRHDLFERFKRNRLGAVRMLDLSGQSVAEWAIDDLDEHQRIISLADAASQVEDVSFEDVRGVLERITASRYSIRMVP